MSFLKTEADEVFAPVEGVEITCSPKSKEVLEKHTAFTPESLALAHIQGLEGPFQIHIRAHYPLEWNFRASCTDKKKKKELPSISVNIGEGCIGGYMYRQGGQVLATDLKYNLQSGRAYTGPTGTKVKGGSVYKTFFANYLDICRDLGMEAIDIMAGDVGSYAWLRYGYLPDERSWQNLRTHIQSKLERLPAELSANTLAQIKAALDSDDPKGAWLIADQREEVNGQPVGFHLLYQGDIKVWDGSFDLTDEDSIERARAYIGYSAPIQPAPKKTSGESVQEREQQQERDAEKPFLLYGTYQGP